MNKLILSAIVSISTLASVTNITDTITQQYKRDFKDLCYVDESPEKYSISDIATLYQFTCMYAAYNISSVFYIEEKGSITSLTFSAPRVSDGKIAGFSSSPYLTGAMFDASTKEITTYTKYRGIGDAYDSLTYKYLNTDEGFSLVKFEVDDSYDGEINPTIIRDYSK